MWEINNYHQWSTFFYSVLLGIGLCVLYDLFRLDRKVFRRSAVTVFFEDIVFWLIAALATFCLLLLHTNGQVRAFVLIGLLIGFLICRLTLTRLTDFLIAPLRRLSRKIRVLYLKAVTWLAGLERVPVKISLMLQKKQKRRENAPKKMKKSRKSTCNGNQNCV